MIRIINAHPVVTGTATYYEFAGLSTDSKPVDGVSTGSMFTEVNTGKTFAYDESSSTWIEQPSSGGGGGGGGGGNVIIDTEWWQNPSASYDVGFVSILDASVIADYIKQGKTVVAHLPRTTEGGTGGSASYGCEGSRYVQIAEYAEHYTEVGEGGAADVYYPDSFYIPTTLSYSYVDWDAPRQTNIGNMITAVVVNGNGKLYFKVYVE